MYIIHRELGHVSYRTPTRKKLLSLEKFFGRMKNLYVYKSLEVCPQSCFDTCNETLSGLFDIFLTKKNKNSSLEQSKIV